MLQVNWNRMCSWDINSLCFLLCHQFLGFLCSLCRRLRPCQWFCCNLEDIFLFFYLLQYVVPVYNGWQYFKNNKGLVTGIVLCGFGFGAFVFNFISTAIVNPNKEEAVDGLFSPEVANNVPKMIRTMVYCWIGLAVVSIALFFPY